MARVFVTRRVPGRAVEIIETAGHQVHTWPGEGPPSPQALLEGARGAQAVLAMLTDRFDGPVLAALPGLRVVANMAVGYDNIDVDAAAAAGVWATNTPGVLAETTADMAFALLLAAGRKVLVGDRSVRAGEWATWSPTGYLGTDVHGATLGIVGLGSVGGAVARRAAGFAMSILYTSRHRRPDLEAELGVLYRPLGELLAASDFVSLHVPLTGETRGLIAGGELSAMKPGAILVNTARGGVVDQGALVAALKAGVIGGAALDVADPEPVRPGDPLLDAPNLIITPHIASATVATRARMAEMAAANIVAALDGHRPPNAVNLVAGSQ